MPRLILLGLCGAFVLMAPIQAAAQSLPTDPCLSQPTSCLPNVDQCLANPASCLPSGNTPDPGDTDPCLENPASCVPAVPCLAQPSACLPEAVDPCGADPKSCLPPDPTNPSPTRECLESPLSCLEPKDAPEPRPQEGEEDQQDDGIVAPGRRNDPPRSSRGGTSDDSPSRPASRGPSETRAGDLAEVGFSSMPEPTEGPVARIGRGLQDAAERFAFPLALAAMVAAFLFVQNRIDGRDPKLAVAPIDSRDDLVMYE